MYPIILQYGIIKIGSYGIMLGLAFYCSFLLGEREFKLKGKDPELAYKLLLAAIACGIIGAKLFHVIDNFKLFLDNPKDMLFSGAGLSVYGGIILSLIVCYFIIKKNKEDYLKILDLAAPCIAVGYFLGRIGCHTSGDGCYGIETASFLGTAYPNGIAPIAAKVFPTPLFESFLSFLFVGILLKLRKLELPKGQIFFIYLILNTTARFFIEFIRLNHKIFLSLTQAQVIALVLFLIGVGGIIYNFRFRKMAV